MVYSNWTATEQLLDALDDARKVRDEIGNYDHSIPYHVEQERERVANRVRDAVRFLADEE